jgi:hypothetical protein
MVMLSEWLQHSRFHRSVGQGLQAVAEAGDTPRMGAEPQAAGAQFFTKTERNWQGPGGTILPSNKHHAIADVSSSGHWSHRADGLANRRPVFLERELAC